MGRPVGWKPYTLADGTRVPSVTTITSRFKESGGLIHWAWDCGIKGLDYRDIRDSAADAGTLAHKAVEAFTKGAPWEWPTEPADVVEKAKRAFGAFEKWASHYNFKVTQASLRLVSEEHRFGGELDATMLDGAHVLGDYKTGALYADHLIQVAGGYKILWDENFPDEPITGGIYLLRFDKEYGDFTHREFTDVPEAAEQFLLLRQAYENDLRLKKRFQ